MSHVRQQIRDRILTICGGLTTTTTHVYNTRLYALIPESNLPALLVYTQTEDPGLNGLCVSISLTSTEIEFTSESEHPIGVIKLSFDCLYYTAANNSTISIT